MLYNKVKQKFIHKHSYIIAKKMQKKKQRKYLKILIAIVSG